MGAKRRAGTHGQDRRETIGGAAALQSLPLMGLYLLSGASGIVFEVAFARLFSEKFGHTNLVITLVLTSYMGGMALGAFLAERWVDRVARPIRIYGLLELGIAIWCATAPLQIEFSDWLSAALGEGGVTVGPRWVLASLFLLVPTAGMGATLPLLGRVAARRLGASGVAWVYGANTVGAMGGALLAGFGLLRWVGVSATLWSGVALGALTGGMALLWGGPAPHSAQESLAGSPNSESCPVRRIPFGWWVGLLLFSGAAALASEVLWTRLLVFVLGASVLSFALVVAVVLAGVGAGSLGAAALVDRWGARERWVGWALVGYGVAGCLSVWVITRLPDLCRLLSGAKGAPVGLWKGMLVAGLVAFLPSLLLGTVFPLAVACLHEARQGTRLVGRLYAAVTIGNVMGAAAATWILVPVAGAVPGLLLLGVGGAMSAALILGRLRWTGWWRGAVLSVAVGGAAVVGVVAYPPSWLNALFNFRASHGRLQSVLEVPQGTITIHDVPALPALERNPPPSGLGDFGYAYRLIAVDGTTVAGTAPDLRTTQRMQAHIPLLLHGNPKRVLQIGYGSGETSREVMRFGVDLEVAEINPGVVSEATRWFPEFAGTGFRLLYCDAKSYIRTSIKTYDVILNDSTYPGVAGASELYSADHFKACRDHLNPGGVFSTWLPIDLPVETLKMVLATFSSVFPQCALWLPSNCLNKHGVLVGSLDSMPSLERALLSRPWPQGVTASLDELGFGRPEIFLTARLLRGEEIGSFVRGARVNDDNHPLLEFPVREGRISGEDFWGETLAQLLAVCPDDPRIPAGRRGMLTVLQGQEMFLRGDPDGALRAYRRAGLMVPGLPGPSHLAQGIRVNRATKHLLDSLGALGSGDRRAAEEALARTLALCRESVAANFEMGSLLMQEGNRRGALPYLEASRGAVPPLPELPLMLADAYLDSERYQEAEALYEKAAQGGDRRFEVLVALADAKKCQGKIQAAQPLLEEALRLRPHQKAAEILLAEVEAREGRTADAVKRLDGVLKSSPGSVLAMERLADLYSILGESARAYELWSQVLKADPANRDARSYLTTHPAGAGR